MTQVSTHNHGWKSTEERLSLHHCQDPQVTTLPGTSGRSKDNIKASTRAHTHHPLLLECERAGIGGKCEKQGSRDGAAIGVRVKEAGVQVGHCTQPPAQHLPAHLRHRRPPARHMTLLYLDLSLRCNGETINEASIGDARKSRLASVNGSQQPTHHGELQVR